MEDDKVMSVWWTAEGKVVLELMGRAILMDRIEAETLFVDLGHVLQDMDCLLYTSPSPRDRQKSRMPSSA